MNIITLLKFITTQPLTKKNKIQTVIRFVKWQINTSLNHHPVIYPFTEKADLIIQKGMVGATGNLYCGLHEFNEMAFLIHLLREDDNFIDIGSNIGSYTVLASGHVGARTISIEPVPSTFLHLIRNISINQIHEKVTACNLALGSKKGIVNFTSSLDALNHVVKQAEAGSIEVPVETLDDLLLDKEIPLLLKIDVEGFETEVIRGATKTLQQNGLKAIIIELNGSGLKYGYEEQKLHDILINLDFMPFEYNPLERKLNQLDTFGKNNTIYIRDLNFVQERLKNAPKLRILNQEI